MDWRGALPFSARLTLAEWCHAILPHDGHTFFFHCETQRQVDKLWEELSEDREAMLQMGTIDTEKLEAAHDQE
jgi:hypothetical protein